MYLNKRLPSTLKICNSFAYRRQVVNNVYVRIGEKKERTENVRITCTDLAINQNLKRMNVGLWLKPAQDT